MKPTKPGWYMCQDIRKKKKAVVYVDKHMWFEFHGESLWYKGSVDKERVTWGPRVSIEEWMPEEKS